MSTDLPPNKPRPVAAVAHEALEEILARREVVRAVGTRAQQEEKEADLLVEAFSAFFRVTAKPLHALPRPTPSPASSSTLKPGDLKKRVLECLSRSLDRLSREEIAEQVQHNGKGLKLVLGRCVSNHEIDEHDGKYGLPSVITTT